MTSKQDFTKINENKVYCNVEILDEVVEERKSSLQLVSSIVEHHSQFIRRTIETGAYENVLLPYLGKIKCNTRKVQMVANRVKKV